MKAVAFDLETIANPAIIEFLPPVTPDPRLKDEKKIKASIEERKLKQIEDMGLNRWQCLICVAGFMDLDSGEYTSFALDESMDEAQLLKDLWNYAWNYDRFISFNGMEFDVPVLVARSALRRVKPSKKISTRKYYLDNHIDLRMLLNNWDSRAKGDFDFFCKLFLGEGKPGGIDGSMVQHYWDCGMIDKIVEYCKDDVAKVAALYERLTGFYY